MITLHLKQIRTDKGITQEELANLCEVSRQTIISLENGTYNPSLLLAFKISHVLNISLTNLITYKP